MAEDEYLRVSCPNCESQYAVDYIEEEVNGRADYCPFCGDEIPGEEETTLEEDEEEDEESPW